MDKPLGTFIGVWYVLLFYAFLILLLIGCREPVELEPLTPTEKRIISEGVCGKGWELLAIRMGPDGSVWPECGQGL